MIPEIMALPWKTSTNCVINSSFKDYFFSTELEPPAKDDENEDA